MEKQFKIKRVTVCERDLNKLKEAGLVRNGQAIRKDKRAQIYRRAIGIFERKVQPICRLNRRSLCFALTGILDELAPEACIITNDTFTLFPEWLRYVEEEIGQERFEEGGYYWRRYNPIPRIEALNKMLSYM